MATYTQQIKELQILNQEIKQRHSSMRSYTEQVIAKSGALSEEQLRMVNDLSRISSKTHQLLRNYELELLRLLILGRLSD